MKRDRGVEILERGESLATIAGRRTHFGLVSHGAGQEVVRIKIQTSARFGIRPEEGFEGLEAFYVESGRLLLRGPDPQELGPGDALSGCPVRTPVILEALEEAEVLYVTSRPNFAGFSADSEELFHLARETEIKDGYTAGHCQRLQDLALRVGVAASLPPSRMHALLYGAYLHDVGKVSVPTPILQKPSALSREEWDIMHLHPTVGRQMVEKTFMKEAAVLIGQHHERLDGRGYPEGVRGRDILFESQIISVVDAFDAMTTDRPYRLKMPRERALEILWESRGTQFDADIVQCFADLVDGEKGKN